MEATSENSNVMNVVHPVDDKVDFLGRLIVTYLDVDYSRDDLLTDSYKSHFLAHG
jgi:hypothetical protein